MVSNWFKCPSEISQLVHCSPSSIHSSFSTSHPPPFLSCNDTSSSCFLFIYLILLHHYSLLQNYCEDHFHIHTSSSPAADFSKQLLEFLDFFLSFSFAFSFFSYSFVLAVGSYSPISPKMLQLSNATMLNDNIIIDFKQMAIRYSSQNLTLRNYNEINNTLCPQLTITVAPIKATGVKKMIVNRSCS